MCASTFLRKSDGPGRQSVLTAEYGSRMRRKTSRALTIPQDEASCASALAHLRWPKGFQCVCGHTRHRRIRTRPRVFVCRSCRRHHSVTAGTLLHGCHVPTRYWFVATSLIAQDEGVSASYLSRRLRVTYETAWQLLHRIRSAVAHHVPTVGSNPLVAVIGFGCSRPYRNGGRPSGLPRMATVAAASGNRAVAIGHLRHRCRVDHWMRNTLRAEPRPPSRDGRAMFVLLKLWRQVVFTHAGLSELWLHRYLAEAQFRQNGGHAIGFLRASLRAEKKTFQHVRPQLQPWGFSRRWLPWRPTPLWRVYRHQAVAAASDGSR